jgi:hypothetical protein
VSGFKDISSGPHDTYAQLSAQQREQLRQHRIQESKDALKLITRVAAKEGWSEEDLENVLGCLGLTGELDSDHGSYAVLTLPMSGPGRPPRRHLGA